MKTTIQITKTESLILELKLHNLKGIHVNTETFEIRDKQFVELLKPIFLEFGFWCDALPYGGSIFGKTNLSRIEQIEDSLLFYVEKLNVLRT